MSVYQRYLAEQHPITVERQIPESNVASAAVDVAPAASSTPAKRKASETKKSTAGKRTLANYIRRGNKKK